MELNPTTLASYPEINALLHDLLSSVQTILGAQFVGMYLHGSLALGDFTPHRSDIDLIVATRDDLPDSLVAALRDMHDRLVIDYPRWGQEVECSYIPLQALRRYDPANALHAHIGRGGRLVVERHYTDSIIQRYIVREQGITLAGPPPHTFIDPIAPDELRLASAGIIRDWWEPMLHNPTRSPLTYSGYQAYAVLTMCRILYTLAHGTIVSKPTAARWAQQTDAKPWSALIERALQWQDASQEAEVEETLELIRHTVERCQEWHRKQM